MSGWFCSQVPGSPCITTGPHGSFLPGLQLLPALAQQPGFMAETRVQCVISAVRHSCLRGLTAGAWRSPTSVCCSGHGEAGRVSRFSGRPRGSHWLRSDGAPVTRSLWGASCWEEGRPNDPGWSTTSRARAWAQRASWACAGHKHGAGCGWCRVYPGRVGTLPPGLPSARTVLHATNPV